MDGACALCDAAHACGAWAHCRAAHACAFLPAHTRALSHTTHTHTHTHTQRERERERERDSHTHTHIHVHDDGGRCKVQVTPDGQFKGRNSSNAPRTIELTGTQSQIDAARKLISEVRASESEWRGRVSGGGSVGVN